MAHDTNLMNLTEQSEAEGSKLIAEVLSSHRDYFSIEDKEEREGEQTDRGFFFASTEKENYEIAKNIFEELC